MIQKKICMLGSFAVGKTSLIARFVRSIFSEKYLTTVGVKIDRKVIQVDGKEVNLLLWDLHGDDEYQRIRSSYLRGTSGYFLVADGTRSPTLEHALFLQKETADQIGNVPFIVLLNKDDLKDEWEIDENTLQELQAKQIPIVRTSAKTGQNVERAFEELTRAMISRE